MPEGPEAEKYAKRLQDELRKRDEAKETAKRAAADDKASGGHGGGGGGDGGGKKKPRVDYGRALLEAPDPNAPALKIPLPFTLKKVLVEDW
jgi:hypothetical protein